MRIAIIAFAYMEYTVELANALAETQKILLILPESKSKNVVDFIDERVETAITPFPRIRNPLNIYYVFLCVRKMHQFKPDVIHFQGGFLWFNLALPFLGNCPLVTTIHDPNVHSGDWQSKKMILFKPNSLAVLYSKKIIVHGFEIKRFFLKSKFFKPEKMSVIPHGNFHIYEKWKLNSVVEDDNYILFFGRIWKYKGLEYLIEAEPEISKEIPNLKIVVAGVGEPIERYLALIKNPDHFLIYNYFVPNQMVAWLFQKAAVVVLPYIECSQSGVIPLAYSFAKPVIATRVGSIPEIVENDNTGILIPPKNSAELANAVVELLKDMKKRKRLGRNAYQKVQNELGWDRIAQMTIQVYNEAWKDMNDRGVR